MDNNLIIIILVVVILLVIFYSRKQESYSSRFGSLAYKNECEFQPACLWDTARWVRLSNGTEGVCTLHGIACPAFSKDHERARNMGLSPTMVSDKYMQHLQNIYGKNSSNYLSTGKYMSQGQAGETALEMLI